jgi:L-fuconolactonase
LTVVIDHLAKPPVGSTRRQPWYDLMSRAADNPRVFAKMSGLYRQGGGAPASPYDLRPWICDALELFGRELLLVGSDWPVAEIEGGYRPVLAAVIGTIRSLVTDDAAAQVLAGTAIRVYGLAMPARR